MKRRTSLHFPVQSGMEGDLGFDLRKEAPIKQPEQPAWAVTHSAIVHARSATRNGVAFFFAPLIGQTVAGGDPHANIPNASSSPLSFFRRSDGASMGLASHRKIGSGSRATRPDPGGNQPELSPLSLVPSPAGWERHGATASAPSGLPTLRPFVVGGLSPGSQSSAPEELCRSRQDDTPSGGPT